MCDDHSDRRLDPMFTRTDAVQMGQCRNDADRPMAAHSQIASAIEKDDSSYARFINRSTQQSTNERIGTTRIVYNRAAKVIVITSEVLETIGERIVAELRAAADDYTSRLAAGV